MNTVPFQKKKWIAPEVEIISRASICSGTENGPNEATIFTISTRGTHFYIENGIGARYTLPGPKRPITHFSAQS